MHSKKYDVNNRTGQGFPQAFLEVTDVTEVPNDYGYSPEGYFQKREGNDYLLALVADLYSVTKIGSIV